MNSPLSEFLISQKTGTVTASSSILAWLASVWGWVDANLTMLQVSSFASFLLVLVMIVSHFCDTTRKNREHGSIMRERELRIELLEKELKAHDAKKESGK